MGDQFYRSGYPSGFQYQSQKASNRGKSGQNDGSRKQNGKDEDLIIEENTVYEIDRECYERVKKQKKR